MKPMLFEPLLEHLTGTPSGARLAKLSVQTKVEKFVLAEIASAGESRHPNLEFWLEESPRRDLTVRQVVDSGRGPLIEWIEAKMCYSDCVARALTNKSQIEQYSELVSHDAAKQDRAELPPQDIDATLTAALFVFHRTEPHERHVYYPSFKNRRDLSHQEVREEAVRYCTDNIARRVQRDLAERVEIRLDQTTEMLCFVYRSRRPGRGTV
jgi:hypothetical protein